MKSFGCLSVFVLMLSSSVAEAQVKQQLFVGAGVTAPRNGGPSSTSMTGGYAIVLSIVEGWSVRPVVSVARVNPTATGKDPFASVLAGALVIRRITPTFTFLTGGGMNTSFPLTGVTRTPVFLVSTGSKISNHWILLTPVVISEKGIGFNTQFALSW